MKKSKQAMCFILSGIFGITFSSLGVGKYSTKVAFAEGQEEFKQDFYKEEYSTRGIYTALSLSINGGDSKVWVTAKNDITIFPATVLVVVELYSSSVYYESHTDMELIYRNSTTDLNMGDTIVAEGSTNGVQRYWQGRMRYKVDNGSWKEETTGTVLYSADGTFLGIT